MVEVTYEGDGEVTLYLPNDGDMVRAAGTAAVLVADELERVHEGDHPFAERLRDANYAIQSAHSVSRIKADNADEDPDGPWLPPMEYADIVVLSMAADYYQGTRNSPSERNMAEAAAWFRDITEEVHAQREADTDE